MLAGGAGLLMISSSGFGGRLNASIRRSHRLRSAVSSAEVPETRTEPEKRKKEDSDIWEKWEKWGLATYGEKEVLGILLTKRI